MVGVSKQTLDHWKRRGVPGRRYADVASALNWSVDQLISGSGSLRETSAPRERRKNVLDMLMCIERRLDELDERDRKYAFTLIKLWCNQEADAKQTASMIEVLLSNDRPPSGELPTGTLSAR